MFFFPQMVNLSQSCASLRCVVSREDQLVGHVGHTQPALRSEQPHRSVRVEQDALHSQGLFLLFFLSMDGIFFL